MQDLKDVTNNVHYENYRSRKLAAVTYNGVDNKTKGQLTKYVHHCSMNNINNGVEGEVAGLIREQDVDEASPTPLTNHQYQLCVI